MTRAAPDHPRHWSLEIFQMASHRRLQRALQTFERVAMPGVHVLGVIRDDEFFVIVDATTLAEQLRSRQIVMSVDPMAVRAQSASPRSRNPSRSVDGVMRRDLQ